MNWMSQIVNILCGLLVVLSIFFSSVLAITEPILNIIDFEWLFMSQWFFVFCELLYFDVINA
ncbi:hypothetical protein K4L44_05390 [Halosquirtibacter laminarini]|uniref:Uncharacterized protein n=1 Tax=Halosquirtibacter laminarini TaxID=3374600 RepID=A0AC61NQ66_9BACT|nr:hypothetical protein K4L44_05390 [Prolixibacteraceae bacterium]